MSHAAYPPMPAKSTFLLDVDVVSNYVSRLRHRPDADPGKGLTDTGTVGGHLLRPEQALQFARVVADGLHIVGGDLQQPAQILVE